MSASSKILAGLREALDGHMTRVTIDGNTWVRHDANSPEAALAMARGKIDEQAERIDKLEAMLRVAGYSEAQIRAATPYVEVMGD